jgi:hypothetical protein
MSAAEKPAVRSSAKRSWTFATRSALPVKQVVTTGSPSGARSLTRAPVIPVTESIVLTIRWVLRRFTGSRAATLIRAASAARSPRKSRQHAFLVVRQVNARPDAAGVNEFSVVRVIAEQTGCAQARFEHITRPLLLG